MEIAVFMSLLDLPCSGRADMDLKACCEETVQLFCNTQINEEIQSVLRNQIEKELGAEEFQNKLFAVRSSAAGNACSHYFINMYTYPLHMN